MSSSLLSLLEGVWSAEEFNRLSSVKISTGLSESSVRALVEKKYPEVDFDALTNQAVRGEMTYKELAKNFTQVCFEVADNRELLQARRNWIKSRIERNQFLFEA
ncbi:hypothetical protein HR060_01120 [Catenovulum sp. SM1970]|uniref:hypothetical protein n=1 Tax=Marinifaba aquimaris TaxID=2741323 RepID=UPI0015738252|nr:hypothetical protein [Marinifaba aquimaris]NTS75452.1 hypothetical protein [Marinifaba aquimaris]